MLTRVKYGKIAIVIFITVLIWVWVDLDLDEELPDKPAVIIVDESANPKLWVSFNQDPDADIKITLSGPHAAIAEEARKLKEGKRLEFDFDAAQEKMDAPGKYTLNLLSFLQKNREIRQRGLKVQACEPEIITVNVAKLVERSLTVQCFDGNRIPVKVKSVDPPKVNMFVPEEWSGEKLTANVQLTRREIDQARLSAVEKTPFIELAAGQIRELQRTVKITMPPDEDLLADYTITATLGIALSPNLQGKYSVEVTNLNEVISPIAIRATPDAKQAYELQPYPPMTLYILDDDTKKGAEEQRRKVVYNLPPEFVRKGEIELKNPQQPAEAKFKLIALPSTEASSGGIE